ncbi:MAG: hypothetical protein ACM31C_21430 [Acidobacteriota bacterium]
MRTFQASFATWMSRAVCCAAITACSAGPPSTSLAGSTACDGITCGSGQLCVQGHLLPDDGGIPAHCVDIAPSCPVFDCDYQTGPACSSCVFDLCETCTPGQDCAIVRGRTLTCV